MSSTEMKSCFDNRSGKENTVNEKEEPSTKVMQQRRWLVVLVWHSSIVAYVLKMYAIAVVGGIVVCKFCTV
ncbi:hypothetical protein [Wolbachia endosymbiont of Aedes albopictus]|uniref:hypothetical protein n=1 Tax=Wolbachia endosymbiont of Aedes albopictus TaxID=167957 RepID=UPI0021690F14|nr:hypothetical protein [Wolbachia endosymbiont of Aedes albopictus]UVW83822.1 hypothetical protein NHG98_05725 [Wolbachia endosymbiont of Aedes albopictus]